MNAAVESLSGKSAVEDRRGIFVDSEGADRGQYRGHWQDRQYIGRRQDPTSRSARPFRTGSDLADDAGSIVCVSVRPEHADDDSLLAKIDAAAALLSPDIWARILEAA